MVKYEFCLAFEGGIVHINCGSAGNNETADVMKASALAAQQRKKKTFSYLV